MNAAPPARILYLYLRAPDPAAKAEAIDAALAGHAPRRLAYLGFGAARSRWRDGLVLAIDIDLSPAELADALGSVLRKCAAWVVHDGHGRFVEWPNAGPMSRYFDTLRLMRLPPRPFAQLFALAGPGDRHPAQTLHALRSRMPGFSAPAFHFADGGIVLLEAAEPRIMAARRSPDLLRRLAGCEIIDSGFPDGAVFAGAGGTWHSLQPQPVSAL